MLYLPGFEALVSDGTLVASLSEVLSTVVIGVAAGNCIVGIFTGAVRVARGRGSRLAVGCTSRFHSVVGG